MDQETLRELFKVPVAVYLIWHLAEHLKKRPYSKFPASGQLRFPITTSLILSAVGRTLLLTGTSQLVTGEAERMEFVTGILLRGCVAAVVTYGLCFLVSDIDKHFSDKRKSRVRDLVATPMLLFLFFEFHDLLLWIFTQS